MWQIVIQCGSHRKLARKMFPDFWQSWPRHINSFALCLSLASCLPASVWASRPHFLCLWHTPCAELHSAFFWPLHPAARVLYNNKWNSFNSFSLFKVPDIWMYVMVHLIIAFFLRASFFSPVDLLSSEDDWGCRVVGFVVLRRTTKPPIEEISSPFLSAIQICINPSTLIGIIKNFPATLNTV